MLRHEASVGYESDASYLSMTEVKKRIATKSGTIITKVLLDLLFKKIISWFVKTQTMALKI